MRSLKKPHSKSGAACLELRSDTGEVLFADRIESLAVPDWLVLQLSEKFFDDPQPCFIHRGAVLTRLFFELERKLASEEWIQIASLPPDECAALSAYPASFARLHDGKT